MIDPEDFAADPEGRPNHYLHPDLGLCVLREGMSLAEFIASLDEPEPEPRRQVLKSVIISRLIDAGLIEAARAALDADAAAYARWWAPDRPAIYHDDPDALALLAAIGADADVILAP